VGDSDSGCASAVADVKACALSQPEGCQQNLRAALEYAVDWTVFPTKPDKRGSYKSAARSGGRAWGATSDPDEICRDFVRWPDAGIGIPTGAGNGIVVVEYDTVVGHGVDGAAALEEICRTGTADYPTPCKRSPRQDHYTTISNIPALASRSSALTRSLVPVLM
jgi:hypothetical protein